MALWLKMDIDNFFYLLKNLRQLRKVYRSKKRGFTCDKKYRWLNGIYAEQFGVEKIRLPISNGYEGVYCMYGAEKLIRGSAFGAMFDLESIVGLKPIRLCTFREFIRLYGLIILDGIDE